MSKIITREKTDLPEKQLRMIKSGWGDATVDNTSLEKIVYRSNGLKVKGFISYPNTNKGKYPCVIWNRGGIGDAGALDSFNARGILGQIASWGYVVFASQYRGNDGGEGRDEFGGADIDDVLNLTPLADEVFIADTTRWAIEGWSRGGMMTYLALTRTDFFKAAIVIGGIANLRCNADESKFMKRLYEHVLGSYGSTDFGEACRSRSIVNFPEKLAEKTPILILHGTEDNRVLPHDSIDIAYKLQNMKRKYRLVMLEGGDHFLKSHQKEIGAMRKKWLEKYLK